MVIKKLLEPPRCFPAVALPYPQLIRRLLLSSAPPTSLCLEAPLCDACTPRETRPNASSEQGHLQRVLSIPYARKIDRGPRESSQGPCLISHEEIHGVIFPSTGAMAIRTVGRVYARTRKQTNKHAQVYKQTRARLGSETAPETSHNKPANQRDQRQRAAKERLN